MMAWILSLSHRRWSSLNMLSLNLVSITSAFYLKLSCVLRTDRRKAKVRYCFIERTFGCPVWLRLVLCLDTESVSLKQWQGPLASALPVQAVTVRNSALTSAVTYPSPCHSTPTLKHARLAFALSLSFFADFGWNTKFKEVRDLLWSWNPHQNSPSNLVFFPQAAHTYCPADIGRWWMLPQNDGAEWEDELTVEKMAKCLRYDKSPKNKTTSPGYVSLYLFVKKEAFLKC